ncbi:hypothetical protein BC830DRAFT_1095390 [Chytriomyces sp. MP71]|nr:hypothetical protein BC830DRAFT_1095390 [Chytriomyces sp. MP71]
MKTPALIPPAVTHRIGNWCEETVLREEHLKDFLAKHASGSLGIQRHELKMALALQPVTLPPAFRFHESVMIKNLGTQGYLSVDLPDTFPNHITTADVFHLTTSQPQKVAEGIAVVPTARQVFRIVPVDEYAHVGFMGATPRYGIKCYIQICDALVERPMYLTSVAENISQRSRKLKYQCAYLTFEKSSNAEWVFVYPERTMRMEMEGQPIEDGAPVIIQHLMTQNALGSESGTPSLIRNDFGVEYDVDLYRHRPGIWSRWTFEVPKTPK